VGDKGVTRFLQTVGADGLEPVEDEKPVGRRRVEPHRPEVAIHPFDGHFAQRVVAGALRADKGSPAWKRAVIEDEPAIWSGRRVDPDLGIPVRRDRRGAGLGNGNGEREQTLNQRLVEMDGFEANEGIIIIAATNRPDVLDPALLRPGRFDRQVIVPRPDIDGREQILAVHMKKVPLAPDVDARVIARGTPGFSGADLANLVNEAALLAARKGKRLVAMGEFEEAKDKVMMGTERRSMVMTEDEKKMTAYHEAGHAIVALHEDASDPIHKATIIPRGRALGMVMRLPERDNYSYHRDKMYANLAVSMGGRVAEEVIFGYDKVSSGASSDISYATNLARDMVTRWGMSDALGPLQYAEADEEVFLGYSVNRQKNMSNETAQAIDKEIRRIVEAGYDRAKHLLEKHRDELETLAQAVLEYETRSGDKIKSVLADDTIYRDTACRP